MRLVILLSFLLTGLWFLALSLGGGSAPLRQGLLAEAPAPQAEPVVQSAELPAAVARLVRQSDTGSQAQATPAVASGQRGPVVLPMPAVVTRSDPGGSAVISAASLIASQPALQIQRVSASAANVRGGPSTNNAVIGRVTRGEEVAVLETVDGWSRIRIEGDGVDGWISTRLLSN